MALPGGPAIVDMYHLTNESIAKKIIASGKIIPNSYPFWRLRFDTSTFRDFFKDQGLNYELIGHLMQSDRYTVGFSEPAPMGWIKSWLMKSVLRHIQNKSALLEFRPETGTIYSFQMQVPISRVVVRDHWYVSPEYFLQKYGEDLWQKFLQNPKKNIFDLRIAEGLVKYFNSSMNMVLYTGKHTYKAPELWFQDEYQLRPFDGIKRLSEKSIETLRESK